MSRSFRFEPPELRPGLLFRQRLIGALLGRWQHRVTVVVGGAGLGKTTLLTQALAENRLAPRGEDVWIGVEAGDADGASMVCGVAAALVSRGPRQSGPEIGERCGPDVVMVADALWRRSPVEMCLVFDDVHSLAPDSTGAVWLGALIDVLPTNAHVVMATRHAELPVPLARLEAQRTVLWLGEGDLRFCDEELARFAADRGLEARRLAATGGWPALAELTATGGRDSTGAFLWEEVLGPLGAEHRRVLTVLCDLCGADDDLMSAALGRKVELGAALDGVPLVEHGVDGWYVPHALWHTATASGLRLDPTDQAALRRRAVAYLCERERFEVAFGLVQSTELWDLAPTVLRAASLASDNHRPLRLGQWLSATPQAERATPPARLAAALHAAFTAPAEAIEPLRIAAAACRAVGDVDAELCANAQLARLGWFRQDASVLGTDLAVRVADLAAAGHPHA